MTLRYDHPRKMIGVSFVKVRMSDGVVRTLTHMKHVSDMKKNLVSLGYL